MEPPDVSRETFTVVLREDLSVLGIALDDEVLSRCADFYETLLVWNRTHNLTRITDPASVATRHFAESLALLAVPGLFEGIPRCVDVGSGAGFPGLPLAIARPDLSWTLVEKTGKKAAFLSYVVATLGLPLVTVISADAATVTERFDLVVSRAVAVNHRWNQTLGSLCAEKGKVVLYAPSADSLSLGGPPEEHRFILRGRRLILTVVVPHSPFPS